MKKEACQSPEKMGNKQGDFYGFSQNKLIGITI